MCTSCVPPLLIIRLRILLPKRQFFEPSLCGRMEDADDDPTGISSPPPKNFLASSAWASPKARDLASPLYSWGTRELESHPTDASPKLRASMQPRRLKLVRCPACRPKIQCRNVHQRAAAMNTTVEHATLPMSYTHAAFLPDLSSPRDPLLLTTFSCVDEPCIAGMSRWYRLVWALVAHHCRQVRALDPRIFERRLVVWAKLVTVSG